MAGDAAAAPAWRWKAVDLTATNRNRLLLGPAEHADVIVDVAHALLGSYVLGNVGPDEPSARARRMLAAVGQP